MLRVKQPLYNVSVGRLSPLPPGWGATPQQYLYGDVPPNGVLIFGPLI